MKSYNNEFTPGHSVYANRLARIFNLVNLKLIGRLKMRSKEEISPQHISARKKKSFRET